MIDINAQKEQYIAIDEALDKLLRDILYRPDIDIKDFATMPVKYGGLGLIYPGRYFDLMSKAQKSLINQGMDIYEQLKVEYLSGYVPPENTLPLVGKVFFDYHNMSDEGIDFLMKQRFGFVDGIESW